jgi:hypothetical protein
MHQAPYRKISMVKNIKIIYISSEISHGAPIITSST